MAKKTPDGGRSEISTAPVGRVDVVTFDLRRNLINVLGDEHYPYAEFLYHELAANAWDSDASEVQIVEEAVRPSAPGRTALYDIRISDDGLGMDFDGLREYFTVGESSKSQRQVSEVRGRRLIGRIGVGKVSILKVARSWRVTTERHRGLVAPVRLTVHVDIDEWISGRLPGFAVQYLEPVGRSGTEIVLEGVHTRLREDRIQRHLQRLPLGEDFMVWRNGELVPPRRWHGISRVEINTTATWEEDGVTHTGPVRGEIWLRPEAAKNEQAYVIEPASEKDGLRREAAGIEVRVDRDMITREFFGHEHHGHAVNRIWGWVEVPWLPILGNRTDYLRDSAAGIAFRETVKPFFDHVYNTTVRYEKDARANRARGPQGTQGRGQKPSDEEPLDNGDGPTTDYAPPTDGSETDDASSPDENDSLASRYAQALSALLADNPELAPIVEQPAVTTPGRPAKDRIYPVRPLDDVQPFAVDAYGDDVAVERREETQSVRRAINGTIKRNAPRGQLPSMPLGEVKVNTSAGVRLRFANLGPLEGPYRWNLDDPGDLTLDVNVEHKLYQETERPGGSLHRMYCAWVVGLALTERAFPAGATLLSDTLETLTYELFSRWSPKRQR